MQEKYLLADIQTSGCSRQPRGETHRPQDLFQTCRRQALPDSLLSEKIEFQTCRFYYAPDIFVEEKDLVADIPTSDCSRQPRGRKDPRHPGIPPDTFVDEEDLLADIQTSGCSRQPHGETHRLQDLFQIWRPQAVPERLFQTASCWKGSSSRHPDVTMLQTPSWMRKTSRWRTSRRRWP